MATTRSSFATRRLVADAVRNTIRGLNLFHQSGAVRIASSLPAARFGSQVDVPIDGAYGQFAARSEGNTVAATDLSDAYQSGTVDQASIGFKWTRGAVLSGADVMAQMAENERLALPVFIEDKCLALAATTPNALELAPTPTAAPSKAGVADLVWAFGDQSADSVFFAGHSEAVKKVALIEESTTGQYIFKPAREGGPVLVHGKPLVASDAFPQYFENANRTMPTDGAGSAVVGSLSISGSIKRQLKKTLRVRIAAGGTGTAATFEWALSRDGETPVYSTPVNVAATIALSTTGLTANFDTGAVYNTGDLWQFLPSSDLLIACRDSMLFSFNEDISERENIVAAEDADERWLHLYFVILALQRRNMSDLPGIARKRVLL